MDKNKQKKPIRKVRTGVVISSKMDKTVVVNVTRVFRHKLYKKIIRSRKKYMAHDEKNKCKIGDMVRIIEAKPISKMKRWVVTEILKRGKDDSSSGNT